MTRHFRTLGIFAQELHWDQTYWTASWDWTTIFYPLVNVYIANWKITIFKNGQSTISMGHGFNSYFDITRGYHHHYTIIIPSLITINHHYHHYHYTINTLPEGIFSGIHIPNQATTHRRIGLSFLNVAEMMDHVWPITVKLRRSNGAKSLGELMADSSLPAVLGVSFGKIRTALWALWSIFYPVCIYNILYYFIFANIYIYRYTYIYMHIYNIRSNQQNCCNTNLVLLRLGLSEVAQNLHNRQGTTLYGYPICDTSGSTEILTTDRGRP